MTRVQDVDELDEVLDELGEGQETQPPAAPAPVPTEDNASDGRQWWMTMIGLCGAVVAVAAMIIGVISLSRTGSLESQMDNKADTLEVEMISEKVDGIVNNHSTVIAGLQAADSLIAASVSQISGRVDIVNKSADRARRAAAAAKAVAERLAKEAATRAMVAAGDSTLGVQVYKLGVRHSSLAGVVDNNQTSQNHRWAQADSVFAAQDSARAATERRLAALEQVLKGKKNKKKQ